MNDQNDRLKLMPDLVESLNQDELDFTIAIPTYNGEKRLAQLLDKLQDCLTVISLNQANNIPGLTGEIIIVDNNSKDGTAKVIEDYQKNWHQPYPLKYYFEAEQGAAFARLRAAREARGQLICFLDDDNLPDKNWLAAAYDFAQKYPKAGAYGGQIHGEYEVKPPDNFDKIQGFLAIREHGSEPHLFDAANLRLPPGAALVVRKQAWCESVPARPLLSGKLPGLMVQGDDYEPLLYIYKAGWEIWYNPAMHTYHQIPHWRLERDYLLSISRGCGLSICQLRTINANNWQIPIIVIRTLLGNLRRIVLHFIKYRQQLKTDVVAASQMEFYMGSLLSTYYYLKNSWSRQS